MFLNFWDIAGEGALAQGDQADEEYIQDDGGYAIRFSGYYTMAEIEYKIALLKEANFYHDHPELKKPAIKWDSEQ
jgi:hypothetical protein